MQALTVMQFISTNYSPVRAESDHQKAHFATNTTIGCVPIMGQRPVILADAAGFKP